VKKLIAILLTASSFLALHAEEKALALVVQTAGKSDLVRDGKTLGVKANDLVRKGDLLRTSKDASMSVQLSTGAIFRLARLPNRLAIARWSRLYWGMQHNW
jgi:hypothetical protein